MDQDRLDELQVSYDRVADEYVRRIYDELGHKPFDRQVLDQFVARVRDKDLVCASVVDPGTWRGIWRSAGSRFAALISRLRWSSGRNS